MISPPLRAQLDRGLATLERGAAPAVFQEESARGAKLAIMDAAELALGAEVETSEPTPPAKLPASLTAREAEVLRLLAGGHTNREIAARLVLSLRTVETHIFNIYAKTNVSGRAAVTAWAIANGVYDTRT